MGIAKLNKNFLLWLFIISCVVRIAFFMCVLSWDEGSWIVFDSQQYYDIAQSILLGNGIADAHGSTNFYRLPGYPLLLSSLLKLASNNLAYALLLQTIITSIAPVLMVVLVAQFVSVGLASMVGVFSVFHLGFILYSGMIASESFFLVFLLLFYITFFTLYRPVGYVNNFTHYSNKKIFFQALISGLLLGVLSLIRPVGHYLLILSVFLLLCNVRHGFVFRVVSALGFITGWASVVAWWLIRNWFLTGYVFFHTLPGLHFLQYSAAHTYMASHKVNYVTARANLLKQWQEKIEEKSQGNLFNEYEQCVLGEKLALDHIKQNTRAFLSYSFVQLAKTICSLHSTHLLFIEQGWVDYDDSTTLWDKVKRYLVPEVRRWYVLPFIYLDIIATILLLLCLMIFCVRCLFHSSYRLLAYQVIPFVGLFWALTIAYGCARLRLPVEPLLMVMAAVIWCDRKLYYKRK